MRTHIFLEMTDYFEFVSQLVEEGKTTGANQSESMIHYTVLSQQRMKRWFKTGKLIPDLEAKLAEIKEDQTWIIITEAWCGDAAHAFAFIEKMADTNDHIKLEWKLRDENPELIDAHLTDGGRSIPKLIVYDETEKELYSWGPRPKHIQTKYLVLKKSSTPSAQIQTELQKMYNTDKGVTMQKEILALMSTKLL